MKTRKPLKRVSAKRARERVIYEKRKKAFLSENAMCYSCMDPATDLHHERGRCGKLFLDERFWMALCRKCHTWVHEHPRLAVERGLMAGRGEWGVCPQ